MPDTVAPLPFELIWFAVLLGGVMKPRTRAAAWRLVLTMTLAYLVGTLYSAAAAFTALSVGAALAASRVWPTPAVLWWALAAALAALRLRAGGATMVELGAGSAIGAATAFWVLGGRHRATYAHTLPRPLPPGVVIRP